MTEKPFIHEEMPPAEQPIDSEEDIREELRQFIGQGGDLEGLVGYFRSFVAEHRRISSLDSLTGVLNRGALMEKAELLFEQARDSVSQQHERTRIDLSVCMIDLDNFKSINDTYGHAAGDAVLKAAADAIRGALREGDLVGRYGGEEFTVVFMSPGHDIGKERVIVAERIRRAIEAAQAEYKGKAIPMTASIGTAKYKPGQTLNELISEADVAMYAAKKAGKNRSEVYEMMEKAPAGR